MQKLIRKLKENDYKLFKIREYETLEIINPENFEVAQDGYRYNSLKNEPEISDWIKLLGKNFYVIGFECNLGDPVIVDAGTEGFPVYFMMHDYWESVCKVAKSFDEFVNYLKTIDRMINIEHQDRDVIRKFVTKLDDEMQTGGYYENLCFEILDEEGSYYKEYEPNK